ncbi:hypothetical protein HK405_011214, partial [Cladochytrium tenue]
PALADAAAADVLALVAAHIDSSFGPRPRAATLAAAAAVCRCWHSAFAPPLWRRPPQLGSNRALESFLKAATTVPGSSSISTPPQPPPGWLVRGPLELRWQPSSRSNTALIEQVAAACPGAETLLLHRGDNEDGPDRVALADRAALLRLLAGLPRLTELTLTQFSYHDDAPPGADEVLAGASWVAAAAPPDVCARAGGVLRSLVALDVYGASWFWPMVIAALDGTSPYGSQDNDVEAKSGSSSGGSHGHGSSRRASAPALRRLTIGNDSSSLDVDLRRLAPHAGGLKQLGVRCPGDGHEAAEGLMTLLRGCEDVLEKLQLRLGGDRPAAAPLLAQVGRMRALREVRLRGGGVAPLAWDEALGLLETLPAPAEVVEADVEMLAVTMAGVASAAAVLGGRDALVEHEAARLAAAILRHARGLRELEFEANDDLLFDEVTAAAAAPVRQSGQAVFGCEATVRGVVVRAVAACPGLRRVELWRGSLSLFPTAVVAAPEDVAALVAGCPQLEESLWVHSVCAGDLMFEAHMRPRWAAEVAALEAEFYEQFDAVLGC